MKKALRLLLLVGLCGSLLLAGCTLRIYGMPKEEWQRLTPAEQRQVREAYMQRRRLAEERRLYEAKQRALQAELEAQRAREAELQARRRARIAASRQERVVASPEIIHFTLEGGTVYVAGRHRPFQPVTVALRAGESKPVRLQTIDGRKSYHVQLVCKYEGGTLWLSNGKSRVHVKQFAYDRQWHQGQRYRDLKLGGGIGLRGANLQVASGEIPAKLSRHPQVQQGPHKPGSALSANGNRKKMENSYAAEPESHPKHPIKPAASNEAPGNSGNRNQQKETKHQQNPAVANETPGNSGNRNQQKEHKQQQKPANSNAAITAPGNSGNSNQQKETKHQQNQAAANEAPGNSGNRNQQKKQEQSLHKKQEKKESRSQSPQSASSHSGKSQRTAAMDESKDKAKKEKGDSKACSEGAQSKKGKSAKCDDDAL